MNPENTPAPDPTVNSPIDPDPNPAPQTPPPKNKRTKLLVGIAAALILIIFALVGFALVSGDPSDPVGGKQSKQFQNWLKPTEEIKIGDSRYVSVCKTLPRETAESIFGKFAPATVIQEDYLEKTVSEEEARLNCSFNPAGDTKAMSLAVETTQYAESSEARKLGRSLGVYSTDLDKVQAELDIYKKAVASSNNKDAKAFVNKLEDSVELWSKNNKSFPASELSSEEANSLVLPASDTLAGTFSAFAFKGISNNVVYNVKHTPKDSKVSAKVADYSTEQIVTELASMKKATDAVSKNIANKSLDQSPTPTIFAGNSDTFGSTKILEPCAIMTPAVFTKMIGGQSENQVERTTVSRDFTTKRYTKRDNSLILPSNECSRETANDAQDSSLHAIITMRYGSSTDQAEEWVTDNYGSGPATVEQLDTDADWAIAFSDIGNPGNFLYTFRVGPYVVNTNLFNVGGANAGAGGTGSLSREQNIQAINALTASIKENVKRAE